MTKSSQSSNRSQKSPNDSKCDGRGSAKNNKDGKKVSGGGGGDASRQQSGNRYHKDQEFYQSPKARSLLNQLVQTSPRRQPTSPRQLRRAQSYDHLKTTEKDARVRSPRHHSSPARLGCKQPPWKSSRPGQRSISTEQRYHGRSSSASKSPPIQRRSLPSKTFTQTLPTRRPASPQASKQKSPPSRRNRTPSSFKGRRSPPLPNKKCSRDARRHQNEQTASKSASAAGVSKPSKETTKSGESSPPGRSKQPQYRKMSPSPERRIDKSRQRSPTNHSRYQPKMKAPYTKVKSVVPDGKNSSPWYACSSPPRSGDLMKDKAEEQKHRNFEKSLQPLVIPTEELEKLTLKLETTTGKSVESHGPKSTITHSRATDATSKAINTAPAAAREVSHQKSTPVHVKQTVPTSSQEKKPPGLQIPSALQDKSHPHAEMTSRSLKNIQSQRQVTSSPSGNIQVTVKDTGGTKVAPTDITAKLRSEQVISRPREPPGLTPLTQLKGTAQVTQKSKGPREVIPEKQSPKVQVTQPAKPSGSQPQQASHQQRPSRPPQQASHQQRAPGPQQTTANTRPGEHPPAVVTQAQQASYQQQSSKPSQPGVPSSIRPSWKPVLSDGSVYNVLVTEYTDPGDFYVQPTDTPLQKLMMDIK